MKSLVQTPGDNISAENAARDIIADVAERGDAALLELGRKFDSEKLQNIEVEASEISEALSSVSSEFIEAIKEAKQNIEIFHRKQLRASWFETSEGKLLGQLIQPIDAVGIYVPGGTAPYPSTVLMTAVPAKVAGVPFISMCSPCGKDGKIPSPIIAAAVESGVDVIYKIGGAQAIAAMALGTETVRKVDKIVGPGNAYVNAAKRLLYGKVGIDMLAGPSEAAVLADSSANPKFVAADLLSQAEHDTDARILFVAIERHVADAVLAEIRYQKGYLERENIVSESLSKNGICVLAPDLDSAVEIINVFAPEHLELLVDDPWSLLPKIRNAGAIMLGHFSPIAIGDYAAGPSHTLPTEGCSRFSSPLNVDDFQKKSSVMWFSKDGLKESFDTLSRIALVEGFTAHEASARIRLTEP